MSKLHADGMPWQVEDYLNNIDYNIDKSFLFFHIKNLYSKLIVQYFLKKKVKVSILKYIY